ncbi:DNA-(apurinic or apyrimidinic site) lyase 2 [Saguinus oedipus]|uniref:exodeoxyribonuclease III n=1 Tax=Saguinus oedipus TaxID=9490 RepID=A0ABQ9V986_SAGOE|nr:DNA-(apurinic or apyrimidinic site) lyase 2 [Saguinus oedipus]
MLRVVSWNINGIWRPLQGVANQEPNNCAAVAVGHILDELDADIICLQETKVTRDALTEPLAIVEGYNSYFSFSCNHSGYSGVATFSNGDVGCYGNMDEFTQEELRALDSEGQALLTQHKMRTWEGKERTLTLINVYCPHTDPGRPEQLVFKMGFYRLLQIPAEALLAAGSHVIILGDLNTVHRPIDHCDSVNLECFEGDPGRKWMDSLLSNLGCQSASHVGPFIDSYRCFQPKQEGAFICWSAVTDTFQASFLLPEVMGSDHCPVGAVLSVSSVPAKQCPLLCTCFPPEFEGTQLKILLFLVPLEQGPVLEQSAPQHNSQTRVQTCQKKARVRSGRPRPSQLGSSRGQKNLKSYFQPSPTFPSPDIEMPSLPLMSALMTPKTSEEEAVANVVKGQAKASEAKDEKEVQISFWKS